MLAIKRILLLVVASFGCWMTADAQTMRQMWMDMPDGMLPYLNRSNRTELADYVDMHVDAAIRNKLEDTTRIESLTPDYIRVKLNAAMRLEMRLLQKHDGSKVLCVVRTWLGPAADSRVEFYDTEWKTAAGIPTISVPSSQLIQRKEGMTTERFDELCAMLDPLLTEYRLSETGETITAALSIPLVSSDDIADLRSILRTVTLRWNGERFVNE